MGVQLLQRIAIVLHELEEPLNSFLVCCDPPNRFLESKERFLREKAPAAALRNEPA